MRRIMLTLAALMLLLACNKDRDIPSDPRIAFVGEYQSHEEHKMYFVRRDEMYVDDSTFTMSAGSNIKVGLAENKDSLAVDLEQIVDDAVTAVLASSGVPVNVELAENVHAQLSGTNEFAVEDWPIKISYAGLPHQGLLSGQGELNGNRLSLEYEVVLILLGTPESPDDTGNFYGEIELEKQ